MTKEIEAFPEDLLLIAQVSLGTPGSLTAFPKSRAYMPMTVFSREMRKEVLEEKHGDCGKKRREVRARVGEHSSVVLSRRLQEKQGATVTGSGCKRSPDAAMGKREEALRDGFGHLRKVAASILSAETPV